jgi:hypothetical protein
MPAEDRPVMTGVPLMTALVKVLLVKVWVAVSITTLPVVFGKVIVLSCVGSTTVKVVSKASAVVPSKTMLASTPAPEMLGLVITGDVRVLLVSVCVFSVPTTTPSPAPMPCIV